MIKRFRLPRVVRLVIGVLLISALITGGVVYGRRGGSNGYGCLAVLDDSGQAVELLEVHTGARYTFRRKIVPWVDLTLQRTSPDGKYVAQLQSTGSRQYTLVVKEIATDKIITTQSNIVSAPDPADYGYHDIVWSPDSNRVALVWSHRPPQERFIVTLKIDGTDLQRRDNVTFLHGWSANGQNLAVSLGTGAQGFNRPLYLWSLSGAKLTVVSRSGYEPIAAVWSPTETRLAFVERPSGNLQGAAWLGIASTTKASVTRLALPSVVQQARARLIWSPDGRYLAVIYDAQGASMLSLIDAGKGSTVLQTPIDDEQTMQLPQLWLENSRVLTYVRANADSGIDWVKYYLDENRYETVVANVMWISRELSPFSGKVIVLYSYDSLNNLELIDGDGTNRVALVEKAARLANIERSPAGKALAILWVSDNDPQQTQFTWVSADTSEPRTVAVSFQGDIVLRWVDSRKAIAVIVREENGFSFHLIKTADGSHQLLSQGISSFATFVTLRHPQSGGQYDGFLWEDVSGNAWIDIYAAEGQRINHFQTDYNWVQTGIISPDRQLAALINRSMNQARKYELLISSADGQRLQRVRSGFSDLLDVNWSPDGKMLAFQQVAANNILTIEILNTAGVTVQRFDRRNVRDELRWARCDAHE